MDDWGVDVVVTGSQKALMLPPGLAFISLSSRAWKRVDALYQGPSSPKAFYFDLRKYRDNLAGNDTPFTPANTLVRALRLSLKRLREEGIENCWKRHARMAKAAKSQFVCQSCGAVSARWAGKCASCGDWNTIVEEAPRENLTPEHLARCHKGEMDKWFPIIKAAGIKPGG